MSWKVRAIREAHQQRLAEMSEAERVEAARLARLEASRALMRSAGAVENGDGTWSLPGEVLGADVGNLRAEGGS